MTEPTCQKSRKFKLTIQNIRDIGHHGDCKNPVEFWDDEIKGFCLRVYPSGKKSFVLMYRYKRRQRRLTLGQFPSLTLQQARVLAYEALGRIAGGLDPAVAKRRESVTGQMLVEEYRGNRGKDLKRWSDCEYRLQKYFLPKFGTWPIDTITPGDIQRLHNQISRTAPIQANRVTKLIRSMFNRAREWHLIDRTAENPAEYITLNKEAKRKVHLSEEDAPRFFEAVMTEERIHIKAGILLYILTAVRNRELCRFRWDHLQIKTVIDKDSRAEVEIGLMELDDTKNGKPFTVYLSPTALDVIKSIPRVADSPWVFPSTNIYQHWDKFPVAVWDRIRRRAGMEHLWIHDLRRTVGTWLANDGAAIKHIGGMLNQSSLSVTDSVYSQISDKSIIETSNRQTEKVLSIVDLKQAMGG